MPRSFRSLFPALAALALFGAEASAQACLGYPSFASNHLQLNAGLQSATGVQQMGAGFVSGSNSIFAGLGLGGTEYDGGGSSFDIRGTLGSQSKSASGRISACPILHAGYGFGPEDQSGAGVDANTITAGFGLAFGTELGKSLLPSLRLGFEYEQFRRSGAGETTSDQYGTVSFALGLKFSEELVLRPSIGISSRSGTEGEPTFGVSLAYNYGRRR